MMVMRREHHEDHELDAVVMFAAQILICTFPPANKICINCVYVCQLVLISPWPHSKEGWADMTNDSSRWLVSVVWCVCVCHLQALRSLIGHTWLELQPRYVQENQLVMNRSISKVLHMMVNYYSQTQPNVYHKDAVLRSLREVQSMTDARHQPQCCCCHGAEVCQSIQTTKDVVWKRTWHVWSR